MQCPRCKNDSPDDADYCGVCYEVLRRKPLRPAPEFPEAPQRPLVEASSWKLPGALKVVLAAAAALVVWRTRGPSFTPVSMLPAAGLKRLGDSQRVSLASCPTPKCLTVYVAPWCPHCRESTPLIEAVRDDLASRGVTTRIVVGMDQPDAIMQYAAELGPDTLMDEGGELKVDGVPHFTVSDDHGAVLRETAGIPPLDQPWSPERLRDFESEQFGLP